MVKVVIASGKGGVGKSMLSSSLALLFSEKYKIVACDCDVDAPNLGIWLGIKKYDKFRELYLSEKAKIVNQKECDDNIINVCKFGAIEKKNGKYVVNPFLCEGCGVCKILYPKAIEFYKTKTAEIMINYSKYHFPVISARLVPGESGSGKIVEELKKEMEKFEYEIAILDSPAGTGCPVIASIRNSDFAVLVTEPSPSGFADLKRILYTVNYFKVPYGVVINKWDLNPDLSKEIEEWAGNKFLGKISYDKKIIDSLINLKPVIYSDSKVVDEIKKIFEKVKEHIEIKERLNK